MNNSKDTVALFEATFENVYVELWMSAIKTKTIPHLHCYISKDNVVRFIYHDSQNIANAGEEFLHLYFNYHDFSEIPVDINKLVEFLTNDEKTDYLKYSNDFLERDAFIYYDFRKTMIKWVKETFPRRFDEYTKSVIKERLENFKKCIIYKNTIITLSQIADENYKSANAAKAQCCNSYKVRDIPKELEHERDELCDKITKLEKFISGSDVFKTLPAVEQTSMKRQLKAMKAYSDELLFRISSISKRREKDADSNSNND